MTDTHALVCINPKGDAFTLLGVIEGNEDAKQ